MMKAYKTLYDKDFTYKELYDYFQELDETDEDYFNLKEFIELDEYFEEDVFVNTVNINEYIREHGLVDTSMVSDSIDDYIDLKSAILDFIQDLTIVEICGIEFYVLLND